MLKTLHKIARTGIVTEAPPTPDAAVLAEARRIHDDLLAIGQALSPEGDILIYACDYGAGAEGEAALSLWADLTGADVAASTDATGPIRP